MYQLPFNTSGGGHIPQWHLLPAPWVWTVILTDDIFCEDSKGGGGFLTGFLIGGAVFGTLGYVFAPQISKTLDTLLNDDGQDGKPDEQGVQSVPRPRNAQYYDEGLEKTRQTLGDKISQLNLAIDKAAARLKRVTGSVEKEAVKDETEVEPL
uniref:Uncharacterized protein n=1 Tax=Triticum urartu TaxID=4572 RepID=A0A8R7TLV6_TRIUA